MLYIVVTQIDVSLKEDVLKHKKDVDLKNVCNIKKCVCLEICLSLVTQRSVFI